MMLGTTNIKLVSGLKCASVIKGRLNSTLILFHSLHLPKRSSHRYSWIFTTASNSIQRQVQLQLCGLLPSFPYIHLVSYTFSLTVLVENVILLFDISTF